MSRRHDRLSFSGAKVFADFPTKFVLSALFKRYLPPRLQPVSALAGSSLIRSKYSRGCRDLPVSSYPRCAGREQIRLRFDSFRLNLRYDTKLRLTVEQRPVCPALSEESLSRLSPRRPRRGNRLPAEKLRCARSLISTLLSTKNIRSLILLALQKGCVHCRSALPIRPPSIVCWHLTRTRTRSDCRRPTSRRPQAPFPLLCTVPVKLKTQRHT